MKKDSVLRCFVIVYALVGTGMALQVFLSLIKRFGDSPGYSTTDQGIVYYLNVIFFCGLLGFSFGHWLFAPSDRQSPPWLRVAGRLTILVWAAILIISEIRFRLLIRDLSFLFNDVLQL